MYITVDKIVQPNLSKSLYKLFAIPYSQFTTISKVKTAFGLTVLEGDQFFPEIPPLTPSNILLGSLSESLPIVSTSGSEVDRILGFLGWMVELG